MYNHEFTDQKFPTTGPQIDFHVVQADDQGSFWNTGLANEALKRVEDLAGEQNTLVVLFIHGWNHNADPNDANMRDFHQSLLALHAELTHPERQDFRARHTGSGEIRVVGIFVGWRGRTLPGPLNKMFTFWGRKPCAERVGDGDVGEFILRLQRIYLRSNANQPSGRYTGLVCIGHSFGGQVLWKSLQRGVEAALVERTAKMSNVLLPAADANACPARVPVDALGDLNVLVNPAFEAYQYGRIDSLYRRITFPVTQVPQVITFSADDDYARKFWFWLARGVSLAARPFRPGFRSEFQRQLYGRALGELACQVTHTLRPVPDESDTLTHADLKPVESPQESTLWDFDFTKGLVLKGVELSRVSGAPEVEHSPVAVVRTTGKIIDGHTGIFRPAFTQFLHQYVAYIEAKRVLLWAAHRKAGPIAGVQVGALPEQAPRETYSPAIHDDGVRGEEASI
jgi:hypothetical protein